MRNTALLTREQQKREHTEGLICTILIMFYPLAALPLIFWGISKKAKWSYVCLALFMAILGYLVVPTDAEDLSRIYNKFEYVTSLSWTGQIAFMWTQMDIFLSGLFMLVGNLRLNKEFIPFISVSIGYLSYLLVFHDWLKKNPELKQRAFYIPLFLVVFCSVSFRNYTLNIRNFVAVSALLIGVYQLYFLKKKTGWIYIAIAPLCHFMVVLVIPFILLAKSKLSAKACRLFLLISFIGIVVNISDSINDYMSSLTFENETLQTEQMTHFENDRYAGVSEGVGYNTNGLIAMSFGYFVTLVMYLYLLRQRKFDSEIRKLVYLTLGLSNLLFHVSIMYGRYMMVASAMFLLMLLWECRENEDMRYKQSFLKKYAILNVLLFILSMYTTRQSLEGCARIFTESPIYFMFFK